jgi:hypothetical protein
MNQQRGNLMLSPNGWTGRQLEVLPADEFHAAIDQLQDDTVPKSYYDKVIGRRAEEIARNGSHPGRFGR